MKNRKINKWWIIAGIVFLIFTVFVLMEYGVLTSNLDSGQTNSSQVEKVSK